MRYIDIQSSSILSLILLLSVERQLKKKIDKGKQLSFIKSTSEKTAEAEQQKQKYKNNNLYISINQCHVSIKKYN